MGDFMKLGRMIGEGGTSDVYEWGNNKVIKLAKPNTNKTALQREYENNLAVWKLGLSVPQPFAIVECDYRPGIVFERIYGPTLKERLFENMMQEMNEDQPKMDWSDIRYIARFLSEIHQLSHQDIPSQRDSLKWQIRSVDYLTEKEKKQVIGVLESLPIKHQICHGDPNPNNILMSNGKLVLIDWNDSTSGNPEADIAEFILMITYTILPLDTPQEVVNFFDSIRETIIQVFMEEYTLVTGTTYDEVDFWIVPIAARKLSADAISEEEKQLLIQEIRSRLK